MLSRRLRLERPGALRDRHSLLSTAYVRAVTFTDIRSVNVSVHAVQNSQNSKHAKIVRMLPFMKMRFEIAGRSSTPLDFVMRNTCPYCTDFKGRTNALTKSVQTGTSFKSVVRPPPFEYGSALKNSYLHKSYRKKCIACPLIGRGRQSQRKAIQKPAPGPH